MSRIFVQFSGLEQIGTECKTVASRVDAIETEFWRTIQELDWDARYEANINSRAKQISRKLEQQVRTLRTYQKFIDDAHTEYKKLDEYSRFFSVDPRIGIILGPGGGFDWSEVIKDIIIDKPLILPSILPLVSPATGLLYITSGIWKGDVPSFFDYSRTPSASAVANWLGYELSDGNPGVTAWIGKANAEAQNEWGYAGVNAYLGKVEASTKADFSFMESKTKKEYKDGKWTEKTTTEFLNAELSAGVDASVLAADGEAGIGSDMLGAAVEAEGALGSAEASVKGEFSIGEDGIELNAKGKAMVSAAEGEVQGTINILGLEITGTLGGYAGGIGVEGEIGLDDGKFKVKGGAAALFGGSVGLEIGFNETGWDNFVDAVTFWD